MDHEEYSLGVRQATGEMFSAGIGYIILPSDIDRATYITQCFKTHTVSIYNEHNGYTNRVPIDKMSLSFIDFPAEITQFGTAVSFIVDPIRNHPIVTGVFFTADELSGLAENQFKFKRELGENFVEVTGSSFGKNLQLNVNADEGGEILLNISSKDESGSVAIRVDGQIELEALSDTTLLQHGKLSLTTVDRDNEDTYATMEQSTDTHSFWDKKHHVNTTEFKINNGSEPFILGKKWAEFMKDFITEVGKSTVTTSLGQMPLLNADQITEYTKKVDDLLSTIGFIDK